VVGASVLTLLVGDINGIWPAESYATLQRLCCGKSGQKTEGQLGIPGWP